MKQQRKLQKWLPAMIAGVALSGFTCLAAAPVTYDFNTDLNGWVKQYGGGTVEWAATGGEDGSGAMKVTLDSTYNDAGSTKIGIFRDFGANPIPSSEYVVVEYDIMIDPASGLSAKSTYGNWQEVFSDAGWSWNATWVPDLGASYNTWTHRRFAVPNLAKTFVRMGFELGEAFGYSGDVIFYIDNIVIKPLENPMILGGFKNADEVALWTGGSLATLSHSTKDSGNDPTSGSLKIDVAYTPENTGWQEGLAYATIPWFIDRYTFISFDVYVENPAGIAGWGHLIKLFTRDWDVNLTGDFGLNANHEGKWTHVELALPGGLNAGQIDAEGIRIQVGGSLTSPATYYVDNIKVYKPNTPPTIALKKAGPSGVEITMDQNGNQWQREAIVTPADGDGTSFFWSYKTYPVSYSFTVADFPATPKHYGFDAHFYIVNGDTVAPNSQLNGGIDWGAPDVFQFRIQNWDNGQVGVQLMWKTNSPDSNPLGDAIHTPINVGAPSAIGTWTVTFNSMTEGVVTGPGIDPIPFTIPEEAVVNYFSPSASFMQFGMFKCDYANNGAGDGHNDQKSGTISAVKYNGSNFPIDEKFTGTTLTANYAWRVSKPSAVSYVPPGTAWWINWTLPADGYVPQAAAAITGPWSDLTLSSSFQRGAMIYGTVPATSLPSPNATFFRMAKP